MPANNVPTPEGPVSYAGWLQWQIAQMASGGRRMDCGPDIEDAPTLWESIWPYGRPNWEVEKELEARLAELEHHSDHELFAEAEASIG